MSERRPLAPKVDRRSKGRLRADARSVVGGAGQPFSYRPTRRYRITPFAGRQEPELETTILGFCIGRNLNVQRVVVWPSKTYGWNAGFAAAPALTVPYGARFQRIVAELREDFDLDEQ